MYSCIFQPFATREDIEDVARMVFSHEFIAGMVEGYDTEVGLLVFILQDLGFGFAFG